MDAASAKNLPLGTDKQRDKIVTALKKKGYHGVTEESDDVQGYLVVQFKVYQSDIKAGEAGETKVAGSGGMIQACKLPSGIDIAGLGLKDTAVGINRTPEILFLYLEYS